MSGRKDKKLRQLYSRQLRQEAEKKVYQWGQMIKEKPKYMPMFIYKWCLKIVLR
jgi:hypothetical protein